MTTFQPILSKTDQNSTSPGTRKNTPAGKAPPEGAASAPPGDKHDLQHIAPNKPRQIYSRNNIHIRRIRDLHRREERDRTGTFFVTGLRFLIQAAQQNARIETLVVAPKLLTSIPAQRLIRRLRQSGVPCLEVPPEVLHNLSLSDDPQGVGAVIRQRWEPLDAVRFDAVKSDTPKLASSQLVSTQTDAPRFDSPKLDSSKRNAGKADIRKAETGKSGSAGRELCWLALDTVQSPGNLGTILRCCDAVGCAGVILLDAATDPYDPACVRASMGALYARRFVRCTTPHFLAWKQRHGVTLVGTSPHAGVDYQQTDYPAPLVLFMGGERKGLSPELQAVCDRMARIPMAGTCDSLNLAMATSVMLYEVFNQRRRGTGRGGYNKGIP